jgi:hypothetical protein
VQVVSVEGQLSRRDLAALDKDQVMPSGFATPFGRNEMRIVFEKGKEGLWYATAENCHGLYRGLLVVGGSIDAVIDKLPAAFADLRAAGCVPHGSPQESRDV